MELIIGGECCVVTKEIFMIGHRKIKCLSPCNQPDCENLSNRECHYCETHCHQVWRDTEEKEGSST